MHRLNNFPDSFSKTNLTTKFAPLSNKSIKPTFETPNLSRQTKIFFNEKPVEDFVTYYMNEEWVSVCTYICTNVRRQKEPIYTIGKFIHACVRMSAVVKILIISMYNKCTWKWGDMRSLTRIKVYVVYRKCGSIIAANWFRSIDVISNRVKFLCSDVNTCVFV